MQAFPRPRDVDDMPGESAGFDRPAAILLAAILCMTAVRLWLAGGLGLTDDEAYYRLWALAPAMSYYDHPPMVGWMIAAGRWIVGDNPFGLRFVAFWSPCSARSSCGGPRPSCSVQASDGVPYGSRWRCRCWRSAA